MNAAVAVLLAPVVAAILVALVPGARAQRTLALLGGVATFAVALTALVGSEIDLLWIPGLEVHFALSSEGASGVLIVIAALVMIPTLLYASWQVKVKTGSYLALLLLMQAGLNGIFLARDLVLFYLFWEATLIPSLMLLGLWGLARRRYATLKYLVYAISGSFLMLIAVLAVRPLSGAASYRLDDLLASAPLMPYETQLWIFIGLALGLAVKLPMWPVHNWLIDFHEQNHPSGTADVTGTLYKVGGWGFVAWALPLLPDAARVVSPILLSIAAFTALYGAAIAVSQTNLKRLLAYASLSHMGLVGVGIFGLHMAGISGGIYLLAAQMITTGGLFLVSGMLHSRRSTFELARYSGLARSAPALAAISLFILLASIGVPGLANFPGEFLSLLGTYQTNPWVAFIAVVAVVAAGIYGVNLYQQLYQGREEHGRVRDTSAMELLVLAPIVAGTLWLGLAPAPQLERIEAHSSRVVAAFAATPAEDQLPIGETPGGEP